MRAKIELYIRTWEGHGYPAGIPDEAPERLEASCRAPSYRAICKAIMKNDAGLASLGFVRKPCEAYVALKRIELRARGVHVEEVRQMRFGR
jgi:predicted phosphoadenosine phosphosulfate sulfurtransferase